MIEVAAAIVSNGNKVLIARRSANNHLAGYWEFPGGKIEPNESPEECLRRELNEEMGIEVKVNNFFMENIHAYKDRVIRLKAFKCDIINGDIVLREHDMFKWAEISELKKYQFAPADIPFINALLKE
jgi:8-oxo-dGTP diphosphatase